MTTTVNVQLTTLRFVRGWLAKLLETITDEQMCHQPVPGANHPLWIMGHLAFCDDLYMSRLGGAEPTSPPEWEKMFDGDPPVADGSAYPDVAVIKQAFARNRERLLAWVDSMDDAKRNEPMPDVWQEFAPTYGALIGAIAAHEAVHLGQLTVVRKSLGMAPAVM